MPWTDETVCRQPPPPRYNINPNPTTNAPTTQRVLIPPQPLTAPPVLAVDVVLAAAAVPVALPLPEVVPVADPVADPVAVTRVVPPVVVATAVTAVAESPALALPVAVTAPVVPVAPAVLNPRAISEAGTVKELRKVPLALK